jgi:hypothetical protein
MSEDNGSTLDEQARRTQEQLAYDRATTPFYISLGRFYINIRS